jgi:rubrerythrin
VRFCLEVSNDIVSSFWTTSNTVQLHDLRTSSHHVAIKMDGDAVPLVLALDNACLTNRPEDKTSPLFGMFLPSEEHLTEVATTVGLQCASGLRDVLLSSTPPGLDFFKSLPTEYTDEFAVYALTLEKAGEPYGVYVGVATDSDLGFKRRMKNYNDHVTLPKLVKKYLAMGYNITHKGKLAAAPMPIAANDAMARLLMYSLEGLFEPIFHARQKNSGHLQSNVIAFAKDWECGVPGLVHWDPSWLGLCTHSALNEGITSDFFSSAAELEEYAEMRHDRRLEKDKRKVSRWRETFKSEDPEGFKAWKKSCRDSQSAEKEAASTQRYRDKRKREDPEKWAEEQHERDVKRRADALANKTYYCGICDKPCVNRSSLNDHLSRQCHRVAVNNMWAFEHVMLMKEDWADVEF